MKKVIISLYLGMVAVLAAATILERLYGESFARTSVYHSPWFSLWWAVLAVATIVTFATRRRWKRTAITLLHLSFVLILGGALTTFLTARKGLVHLPQGEPVREYLSEQTSRYHQLPFTLRLDSFRIAIDPVSHMPADYISSVRLDGHPYTISMNHILRHRGIRLYQSSYDDDLRGSWLTLNCDPWGTPVTYAGYLLLALSLLWLMCRRRSAAVLVYLPVLIVVWWVFGARSSTLMPVLRSGWFVAHVSLVSAAYLLLLAMCLTSIVALCAGRRKQQPAQQSVQAESLPPQPAEAQAESLPPLAERLARTNRAMLLPAIALLAAGIFVGAIWANVSWGRYWGWDPKEVWALITLMVYAIPLHSHSLPSLRRPEVLHRYLAIAFLTVLATYFGVNLLLGGMHSYA